MMGGDTGALLQELQQAVLVLYLSDLHAAPLDERAKILVSEIPDNQFTLSAWNDAVSYITGRRCDFQSVQAAREALTMTY